MTKYFRVLLWVSVIATLPLSAQTAIRASSASLADAPGLTAIPASTPSATQDLALSTSGAKPPQQFSTRLVGNQLPLLRSALPQADLSAAQPGTAKTPAPEGQKITSTSFWLVNGALLASTVANSETLYNCANCTFLPSSMHRRGVTYGVGMPVDAGLAYLGYYLKKNGHRWWYAPALAVTAANGLLAYHWAANTN
jgi:hypothetical protein